MPRLLTGTHADSASHVALFTVKDLVLKILGSRKGTVSSINSPMYNMLLRNMKSAFCNTAVMLYLGLEHKIFAIGSLTLNMEVGVTTF